MIYDNGLAPKWQDFGWAPRDTEVGQAARINFSDLAGWILVRPDLTGTFSAVTFNMSAPARFGDFLEVRLASEGDDSFPRIRIDAEHRHSLSGTWSAVRVAMAELNPKQLAFDRISLRAVRDVDSTFVELSQLAFSVPGEGAAQPAFSATYPARRINLQLDCSQRPKPISPLIYGTAFNPRKDASDAFQWNLGQSIRRWGGNPATRYNWRLGNAWNTAVDWYYMNVNYTGIANYSWRHFLDDNRAHKAGAAITVPMIGWVAKDTQSYSFPISVYGPQRSRFGANQDIGNGVKPNGASIDNADPRRTSIPAPPEYVGEWVSAIRRYDDENNGQRSVNLYYLDNEPGLWSSTHHDVHPSPVTYDELLRRTLDYGIQVRRADPEAVIAGPAAWGWPEYFYSAADAAAGFKKKPDRLAHGDTPLLAWYLKQLRDNESQTGERILNMLDVHYYPEGQNLRGPKEKNDAETADRRIRATRSLWDPNYKDESWIGDKIRLIPRLRALIAEHYPDLGISIGEYNFGGEKHMSGALAQAEVLGRFGQQGVDAAFYWTYPAENSYPYHAFRAYRNYDGQGAKFLDHALSTTSDKTVSLFASSNDNGQKIVAIVLNLDAHQGADTAIDLSGCGNVQPGRTFQFTNAADGIKQIDAKIFTDHHSTLRQKVPPYSITIFEMQADHKPIQATVDSP
jgi:hypothetical protein